MRKRTRQVVTKTYDVYKDEDYIVNVDNLNPLRDTTFDQQYEEILAEINRKVDAQYRIAYGFETTAEADPEEPLTTEGISNKIDTLLNAYNKNPLREYFADGFLSSQFLKPNSSAADFLSNNPTITDCFGITRLTNSDTDVDPIDVIINYIPLIEGTTPPTQTDWDTVGYEEPSTTQSTSGSILKVSIPTNSKEEAITAAKEKLKELEEGEQAYTAAQVIETEAVKGTITSYEDVVTIQNDLIAKLTEDKSSTDVGTLITTRESEKTQQVESIAEDIETIKGFETKEANGETLSDAETLLYNAFLASVKRVGKTIIRLEREINILKEAQTTISGDTETTLETVLDGYISTLTTDLTDISNIVTEMESLKSVIEDIPYNFCGWYLDADCIAQIPTKNNAIKVEVPATPIYTLYALFSKQPDEDASNRHVLQYAFGTEYESSEANKWQLPESVPFTTTISLTDPLNLKSDKRFKGWYSDAACTGVALSKITETELATLADGVIEYTVYGKFVAPTDANYDIPSTALKSRADGETYDIEDCDFAELGILQYILAILKVVKLMADILSTILGVIIPIINIVKEAQLAWINPPFMMSIINQVTQKLMAILFSLIGSILMKLWHMIKGECISANTASVIGQISEAMAGIDSAIASVNSLALMADEVNKVKEGWDALQKQFDELKQTKPFWESVGGAISSDRAATREDITNVFTNPALLYSEAVPQEMRNTISSAVKALRKMHHQGVSMVNNVQQQGTKRTQPNEPIGVLQELV